jgi:hypothetical protein
MQHLTNRLVALGHVDLATILVTAGKLDDLLNKTTLDQDTKSRIIELNSRLKNQTKYVQYLIKNYETNDITELINEFDRRYQKLKQKDINQYSPDELRQALKLAEQVKTKTEYKREGADKVFENDKVIVYIIKSKEASCSYGAGTKWCTTSKDQNMFHYYDQNNNLYYILSKYRDNTDPLYKVAVVIDPDNNKTIYDAEDKTIAPVKLSDDKIPPDTFKAPTESDLVTKFTGTLTKNPDGSYDSDHDIIIPKYLVKDGKLLIKFNKVSGNFNCGNNQLTSLQGAPAKVSGSFYCFNNQLTSLQGAPAKVSGSFGCGNNQLTSLQGAPAEVTGDFQCDYNRLTSLQGAPAEVSGGFWCNNNKLTSLQGAPAKVSGNFYCFNNQLTSLQGAPETSGDFYCGYNKLTSLQGAQAKVSGSFGCFNNKLTSLQGAPAEVSGDFSCGDNSKQFTVADVKKVSKVKGNIYV